MSQQQSSDTQGAIVGGLMGARLGREAIPEHLAAGVLDSAAIHELAACYCGFIESDAAVAAAPEIGGAPVNDD